MEDHQEVDVATSLRSELAALQYKRDRLTQEVEEMRSQIRSRDQHCLELQVEAEQLREQSARQNAIISSLKKRVHELEERERNLFAAQGRHEISLQSAQRDIRLFVALNLPAPNFNFFASVLDTAKKKPKSLKQKSDTWKSSLAQKSRKRSPPDYSSKTSSGGSH